MKKIQYVAPALQVTRLYQLDGILQTVSGPELSDGPANQNAGMDVKSQRGDNYNVWGEDWSR